MTELKQMLFEVTDNWRRTARKTRIVAEEIPNLLARGHMHGVSDGLDLAADDMEKILNKNDRPTD